MRLVFLILPAACLLAACRSDQAGAPAEPSGAGPENKQIVVNSGNFRLLEAPGPESAVLRDLPAGTVLYDLGETSNFTTPVVLNGISFDEPWLKVRTDDGASGWVYGAVLFFDRQNSADLSPRLQEKRLQILFGPGAVTRIRAFREDFQHIRTVDDFARAYREAVALRPSLIERLKPAPGEAAGGAPPNLFWLSEALPAFVPQLVDEGTAYYLFLDYRQWIKSARLTPGDEDDAFVNLCLAIYPADSIEYFYPVWMIQTGEREACSLLGRGLHASLLRQMDRLLTRGDRFRPEMESFRDQIINDMAGPGVTYWEPADSLIRELDGILTAPPKLLRPADRVTLEGRLEQLRDSSASSGILVNRRAE